MVGEVDRLVAAPFQARPSRWSTFGLAAIGVGGVALLHWLQIGHASLVEQVAGVRAALPLRVELARLPGSLVAPAPRLPMWGAVAQVALVFWLGELNLGWRRTGMLIVVCHTVATLAGRAMLQHPALTGIAPAVAHHLATTRDTGPSAAVVGLCVYLGIHRRAYLLCGLLCAAMVVEVIVIPDLAGREHLAAMVAALVVAAPLLRPSRPPTSNAGRPAARSSVLAA